MTFSMKATWEKMKAQVIAQFIEDRPNSCIFNEDAKTDTSEELMK